MILNQVALTFAMELRLRVIFAASQARGLRKESVRPCHDMRRTSHTRHGGAFDSVWLPARNVHVQTRTFLPARGIVCID